jgi:hypothetical protein
MLLDASAPPVIGADGTVQKASVVMVFDGPRPPGKSETSLERHKDRIKRSDVYAKDLMAGETPHHMPGKKGARSDLLLPSGFSRPAKALIEHLEETIVGFEMVECKSEGDAETAEIARRLGGIVLTNDSDFCILNCPR